MDPTEANVRSIVKSQLNALVLELESSLSADVLGVFGPILYGSDHHLRVAIESIAAGRRPKLAVILNTPGGVVEIVERMVDLIRYHYSEVAFVVPDRAMSAGTVFALSGDAIMMDHFAVLGPIDPQIEKDGRLVPALSYLAQYNRLIGKARSGQLTSAELVLLTQFDLAEIHQYDQARDLTISLLRNWLARYKFKNWSKTESRGIAV